MHKMNKQVWRGIVIAGGIAALIVGGLYYRQAHAEIPPYEIDVAALHTNPEPTKIFFEFGLDRELRPVFCTPYDSQNWTDTIVSNIRGGIQKDLSEYFANMSLVVDYTHHSCAFHPDWTSYDVWGATVKWEFNLK